MLCVWYLGFKGTAAFVPRAVRLVFRQLAVLFRTNGLL